MTFSNVDLHYVLPGYAVFGGILRVMMDDAGIVYKYHHYNKETDFPDIKTQWIASGHPFDCTPMIELDGKRYSGCLPIMRILSKKIGKYAPTDLDLEQYVDATADYAMDWIRASVIAKMTGTLDKYKQNEKEKFLKRFDRIYGVHKGSYAAGEEISYCDFFVYNVMCLEQNNDAIKDYPNLVSFYEAFRARPNVQEAIKQI